VSDYPKTLSCGGKQLILRNFVASDLATVLKFASELPPHDLLFLTRDIQHPKVITAWLDAIADNRIQSLLALDGDRVVGSTAIVRDERGWSPHVAELRLLIAEDFRGQGLGRILLNHCFADAVDAGAEKLIARMTPDQRGAIALFEEMGFRGEAMLRDHVKNHDGSVHDLAILSLNVARLGAQHGALGFAEAE
jgi:RimJ/RimL family protein N-acetyltransferase